MKQNLPDWNETKPAKLESNKTCRAEMKQHRVNWKMN
jgi:hypothetical protein